MTKRTNAFQKAILYIHDQLKDTDAVVTESAQLLEQKVDSPINREIDILIEKKINDESFRIALECRDRSKIDDIQWIDNLIGKYLNLPVKRVIAISKSGFSKNAAEKARVANIELRTLIEISELDWKTEYEKLGFADFSIDFKIDKFQLNIEKKPDVNISFYNLVYIKNFRVRLKTLIKWILEDGLIDQIRSEFNKSVISLYKTRTDLENSVLLSKELTLKNSEILIKNKRYKFNSLTIYIIGVPSVRDAVLKSYSYQDSIISTTTIQGQTDNDEYRLYITQAQPENKAQISFEKIKPKSQNKKV